MRFSFRWIREFVAFEGTPEELARRLTLGGLPVDQVEKPVTLPDTVVVGRVVEARKHPNADRLSLCTVDAGQGEPLEIVCGAPNARTGLYSAVGLVGSTLANGLTIRKAKIRGVSSHGMLCSEIELGLGEDADGILELAEATPGTPLSEVLGERDTILDIDVPSNRSDCQSHRGIAREVAALTGSPLTFPKTELERSGDAAEASFSVTVESAEDCPRFTAHIIRDVEIGPSPAWLVEHLEALGHRSINNVVDVTNYVLHETGQPLHSFDLDRLGTNRIHVRRAREGEGITTLDGVDRKLNPEVLLITDGERPIAAGGIMGGANTEVHDGTRNVLLEAACFQPYRILRGSRSLRLDTDASQRFRRGVDPAEVSASARRAAALLAEVAGGKVAPGMVEVLDPSLLAPRSVQLRPAKVGETLGDPVPESEIEERLRTLGFEVETSPRKPWTIGVPSWRRDILEECDLVEEVGRHRGYDTIGVRMLNTSAVPAPIQPEENRRRRARAVLQGFGFQEALTRTMVDREAAVRAGLPASPVHDAFFPILDPPSREEEGLRPSLVPSLLTAIGHNLRHGQPEVRLFELGKTFHRLEAGNGGTGLPRETSWVGLAAAGGEFPPSLERTPRSLNFLEFKGFVEGLLSVFRIDAPKWCSYTGLELVPEGALAVTKGEEVLGFAWDVSDVVRERWDLNRPVYVAQVKLEALPLETGPPVAYREPSRYPSVRRDLALVVPLDLTQDEIRGWIASEAGSHLASLELFDYYRGKHIPDGFLGLGYSLTFRASDRTLQEKEVETAMDRVVKTLETRGIKRREA